MGLKKTLAPEAHFLSSQIASWQENCDKPRQCIKEQRHHFADKGPYSQGYGLPSGQVQLLRAGL